MKTIVISQPMYFPWVGLFEQICLADVFVHFDDVQFARGFVNRVQIKTPNGPAWLTVPLRKHSQKTLINELRTSEDSDWQKKHLDALASNLAKTPYFEDAMQIASNVLNRKDLIFSDMLIESIEQVRRYFSIAGSTQFVKSSELKIPGRKSDLIKNIVTTLGGTRYVTGHGARAYLDHEEFERCGIDVQYMDYKKLEYPQRFPPFTPFVSVLDLIANCGTDGRQQFVSGTVSWRNLAVDQPPT